MQSEDMHVIYSAEFRHADSYYVEDWVKEFKLSGKIIPDSVAQAIASYWHSPGSPQSTILSTMGKVTYEMTREDFATDAEYAALEYDCDRHELDALSAYLDNIKRHHTPSGNVHACTCCGEMVYALPWAKCTPCDDETCECEA